MRRTPARAGHLSSARRMTKTVAMRTLSLTPRVRAFAATASAVFYLGGLATLAVSGVMLWRMYCEGFGCIGKGIAWFAWSVGSLVALAIGAVAHRLCRGRWREAVRYALAVQLAAGLGLLAYWALRA
jgi:cytochrome b subunit of formate dehydrogenase